MSLNHQLHDSCLALHAAVWSKTETLMSSEGAGRTSASVSSTSGSSQSIRLVQGFSVNELIYMVSETEEIDICKVDVEGAEWEIFSHLESCNSLFERCHYLIIEIHPPAKYEMDLVSVIEDKGFKLLAKCKYGDETFLFQRSKLIN